MTGTKVLRELGRMRFEEACGGWQARRLTQEEAARAGHRRAENRSIPSRYARRRSQLVPARPSRCHCCVRSVPRSAKTSSESTPLSHVLE